MENSIQCILVVLLAALEISQSQSCPKCSSSVPCVSSLTECPDKQYLVQNANLCDCCPGCKGGAEFGYFCSSSSSCAPGLTCQNDKCVFDKTTCSYTYHLKHLSVLPTCEVDGTFAAVQCKGDRVMGRCFCYSESGERIFGWAWRRDAEDMTCTCSRMKYKLMKSGQIDNTIHCDQKGNFEPLQCSNGVCWCADAKTGEIIHGTRAVPESMWTFLPCYDIVKMGLTYLRQCESAAYAQYLMQKTLAIHGTIHAEFKKIICDYDGAYGIYTVADGIVACQWRDGTKIGSFQGSSNTISKVNCNCARDQKIFAEAGLTHTLACNGNGNYESIQDINGQFFCVDRDGFAVSVPIETDHAPDCEKYIYYEIAAPPDNDSEDYKSPEIKDGAYMYPDYFGGDHLYY
ncbi:unnamed protein product [Hermetia illucens]|uniref:Thyroglobulin type-1 domain-containing protein n=1 Tax=Hermetia illucens TaxID=343691 RepID=A0A7R8UKF3_HERIL|nr:uncharacterized protein LOC119647726 [Hermetia illucens]CAD7082149.1 unnamed protein product [Hermetia illucens]